MRYIVPFMCRGKSFDFIHNAAYPFLAYINSMGDFTVIIPQMYTVYLEQVHPSIIAPKSFLPLPPSFQTAFGGFPYAVFIHTYM
jgi:hypothetical protein